MKRLIALAILLLSSPALAVNGVYPCVGNSCTVLLEPRTSTGAAVNTVTVAPNTMTVSGAAVGTTTEAIVNGGSGVGLAGVLLQRGSTSKWLVDAADDGPGGNDGFGVYSELGSAYDLGIATTGAVTLGPVSTTNTHVFNVGASSRAVKAIPGNSNTRPGVVVDNSGNSVAMSMNSGTLVPWIAYGGGSLDFINDTYANVSSPTNSGYNGTVVGSVDTSGNWTLGPSASVNTVTLQSTSTTAGNLQITNNSSSTSSDAVPSISIQKSSSTTTTSQVFILFRTGGGNNGQINASGSNAVAFGTTSDRRLKKNIEDLPPQLDNVMALRPVEFDYRDGSGHQTGFIAQEMAEVYPDAVGPQRNGYLMITGWSKTDARLVKALQELNAKFDAYVATHP